jgi:hypothetical protein
VSISTNGGGGIMGGIGFSLTDDDKRGITRATVGEGAINVRSDADGHSLDGLNRDVTQVQEVTKDDHFGMHMTVPIIDPDQMVEEGKVVIPTAYAMYSTGWNALASIGIIPLITAESTMIDGIINGSISSNGNTLEETPKYITSPVKRAINNYNNAFKIGYAAYEYNPEYLPALFGKSIPFIGTFIPGPEGGQSIFSIIFNYSGGIRDVGTGYSNRDQATFVGLGLVEGKDAFSGFYDHGSGSEVFSELFLGNTAPGLEYAGQIINNLINKDPTANSVALLGHSGGVMRSALASKYLGYLGVGVYYTDLSQGPGWGFYNNIQNATTHLSIPMEPVSDMGLISNLLLFTNDNQVNIDIDWFGNNAAHAQPNTGSKGSAFDAAIKKIVEDIKTSHDSK